MTEELKSIVKDLRALADKLDAIEIKPQTNIDPEEIGKMVAAALSGATPKTIQAAAKPVAEEAPKKVTKKRRTKKEIEAEKAAQESEDDDFNFDEDEEETSPAETETDEFELDDSEEEETIDEDYRKKVFSLMQAIYAVLKKETGETSPKDIVQLQKKYDIKKFKDAKLEIMPDLYKDLKLLQKKLEAQNIKVDA